MDFIEWFTREHWTLEKPLLQIHKETGIARTTLKRQADNHGLKIRSISEDNKRRYKNMTGEQIKAQTTAANEHVRKHGQPKNKDRCKDGLEWTKDPEQRKIIGAKISEYKRKHNPMHDKANNIKSSKALAEHLKKNIHPQEQQVINILQENDIVFEHQKVIDVYIPDFYLPDYHLLIEVESISKMGAVRKARMKAKETFYKELGYNIIFVEKEKIKRNPNIILDILRGLP